MPRRNHADVCFASMRHKHALRSRWPQFDGSSLRLENAVFVSNLRACVSIMDSVQAGQDQVFAVPGLDGQVLECWPVFAATAGFLTVIADLFRHVTLEVCREHGDRACCSASAFCDFQGISPSVWDMSE